MKLNHLNLTVPNPAETRTFLEKHFGFRTVFGGGEKDALAVLLDEKGFILTLMKVGHAAEVRYPGSFHVGFRQETEEQVNEVYQRLKDDGIDAPPPRRFHGS